MKQGQNVKSDSGRQKENIMTIVAKGTCQGNVSLPGVVAIFVVL